MEFIYLWIYNSFPTFPAPHVLLINRLKKHSNRSLPFDLILLHNSLSGRREGGNIPRSSAFRNFNTSAGNQQSANFKRKGSLQNQKCIGFRDWGILAVKVEWDGGKSHLWCFDTTSCNRQHHQSWFCWENRTEAGSHQDTPTQDNPQIHISLQMESISSWH